MSIINLIDNNRLRDTLTEFVDDMQYDMLGYLNTIASLRKLKVETLLKAKVFYIPTNRYGSDGKGLKEAYLQEGLGLVRNNYLLFTGRIIYPIFEPGGNRVMGITGYDKFVDTKYLDLVNSSYAAGRFSYAGMEDIEDYYNSNKTVFITEGYVDTLWLKEQGYNALAVLGSNLSYYQEIIARRFKKVVFLPDADTAGYKWERKLIAKGFRTFRTPIGKDIDEGRIINEIEIKKLLNIFS